jgi:hypothetical protein
MQLMPNIEHETKGLNHSHRLLTKKKDPGQSSRGVRLAHPLFSDGKKKRPKALSLSFQGCVLVLKQEGRQACL